MAQVWLKVENEAAKSMWKQGLKSSVIAKELTSVFGRKFTKNMVIGQANRKGFGQRKIGYKYTFTRLPKLNFKTPTKSDRLWSEAERDVLRKYWHNLSVDQYVILELVNEKSGVVRTLNAMRTQAHELKLSRPRKKVTVKRSERAVDTPAVAPMVSFSMCGEDLPENHLVNINNYKCVYIIGEPKEGICCSQKTIDGTYCEHHRNICYTGR